MTPSSGYDYCTGLLWDDTNIGTIYYDDNNGGCGLQAQVNALLAGGDLLRPDGVMLEATAQDPRSLGR